MKEGLTEVLVYYSQKERESVESLIRKIDKERRVKIVKGEHSNSLGDALREVNTMGILRTDFILLGNNIVTNLDIKTAYQYF